MKCFEPTGPGHFRGGRLLSTYCRPVWLVHGKGSLGLRGGQLPPRASLGNLSRLSANAGKARDPAHASRAEGWVRIGQSLGALPRHKNPNLSGFTNPSITHG